MNTDNDAENPVNGARLLVIGYPFAILLIGSLVNLLIFGVKPPVASLPPNETMAALVIAALLLLINHSWLMTATELTRARFGLYSTPEEWQAAGLNSEQASPMGLRELKRHHDTHLNTTENIDYFILLSLLLLFCSPPPLLAQVWILGFALARLGYTYSFLSGKDNARGLFMTLSLLPLFGMASYLVMSLML